MKPLVVESIPYAPYLVRFSTRDGRRRVKTLWAPQGGPRAWVSESVTSYLDDRGDVDASKNVIVRVKR